MNHYYMNQAEMHALRNPHDANAQILWHHWKTAIQQIELRRRAMAAAVPGSPLTASAPQPVPSTLPGAEVPTPPVTATSIPASPGFGVGQNSGPNVGPVHYSPSATACYCVQRLIVFALPKVLKQFRTFTQYYRLDR